MRNLSNLNRGQTNERRPVVSLDLRKPLARLLILGAIFLGFSTNHVNAGETARDVSAEISELRSAILSAEVRISPGRFESLGEITEQRLQRVGCSYQVTEKQDLDPLLDILVNAGLVEHAHPEPVDTLIAIYLTTRSGAVIPLLLDAEFTNSPSLGKYNGMTPVAATKGFETALRTWAVERKSSGPKAYCQK